MRADSGGGGDDGAGGAVDGAGEAPGGGVGGDGVGGSPVIWTGASIELRRADYAEI